jgi:hypothetical protein
MQVCTARTSPRPPSCSVGSHSRCCLAGGGLSSACGLQWTCSAAYSQYTPPPVPAAANRRRPSRLHSGKRAMGKAARARRRCSRRRCKGRRRRGRRQQLGAGWACPLSSWALGNPDAPSSSRRTAPAGRLWHRTWRAHRRCLTSSSSSGVPPARPSPAWPLAASRYLPGCPPSAPPAAPPGSPTPALPGLTHQVQLPGSCPPAPSSARLGARRGRPARCPPSAACAAPRRSPTWRRSRGRRTALPAARTPVGSCRARQCWSTASCAPAKHWALRRAAWRRRRPVRTPHRPRQQLPGSCTIRGLALRGRPCLGRLGPWLPRMMAACWGLATSWWRSG